MKSCFHLNVKERQQQKCNEWYLHLWKCRRIIDLKNIQLMRIYIYIYVKLKYHKQPQAIHHVFSLPFTLVCHTIILYDVLFLLASFLLHFCLQPVIEKHAMRRETRQEGMVRRLEGSGKLGSKWPMSVLPQAKNSLHHPRAVYGHKQSDKVQNLCRLNSYELIY